MARQLAAAGGVLLDPLVSLARPADILSLGPTVQENAETVISIIGHNTGLETLIDGLAGKQQDLPTAALAQDSALRSMESRDIGLFYRRTLVGL